MKKAVAVLCAVLLVGLVLTGVGAGLVAKEGVIFPGFEVEYTPASMQCTPFEKVSLQFCSARTLVWKQGDTYQVDWQNSNLSDLTVQVEEGVLCVRETRRAGLQVGMRGEGDTDFVITLPADVCLDVDADVSGCLSGNFAAREGGWGDIQLDVDGVASLQIGGEVASLTAAVNGTCDMRASGNAERVKLNVNGMLRWQAEDWTCPSLACSGAGMAELQLSGTGDSMQLNMAGACTLKADAFPVERFVADVSGIATLRVWVGTWLQVSARVGSTLAYRGQPHTEVSGNITVTQLD